MKRIGFVGALAGLAVLLLVGSASAQTPFTLNASALAMLYETWETPDHANTYLSMPVSTSGTYNIGGTAVTGDVGYEASIATNASPPGWAGIMIGAEFWGKPYGWQTGDPYLATTEDVIGAALGTGPTGDLSAFSEYGLQLFNDNDDLWMVNIYMNTGWVDGPWNEQDNYYENGWTWIGPGQSAVLTLDFATEGVINLNHVTNIGMNVGSNLVGGDYPSNPDWFHISASPIPEPTALLLLGAVIAGFAGWRLRRK